ncbi:SCP2 sterol-binding domain-containing protein [Nocardia rhizosphaerae]|uniref:SCP2 sterol-binding domain-containing protein n=1 Tax=Nocardia rhizosphaerae TaxID=1691571 RepID=A0ABV8LB58_9NOCA
MSITIEEIFEQLPTRFIATAAVGLTKTLQWRITDAAEPGVWAFEIAEGAGRVIPGGVAEPDTTFTTTSEVWVGVADGSRDAMREFLTGTLKVEGDMTLALKVPEFFETPTDAETASAAEAEG